MTTFNGLFGPLDYIFCAGVSDAICDSPQTVPNWERGMFAFNLLNTAQADHRWAEQYVHDGRRGTRQPLPGFGRQKTQRLYDPVHGPDF